MRLNARMCVFVCQVVQAEGEAGQGEEQGRQGERGVGGEGGIHRQVRQLGRPLQEGETQVLPRPTVYGSR